MKKPLIGLVGAGQIGSALAQLLALRGLAEVRLYDNRPGLAEGKALDMTQGFAVNNQTGTVHGTNHFADLSDSDILVVTAGFPRQPGMTRKDLLQKNLQVFIEISTLIKQYTPNAIIIVVTNPLDIMTAVLQQLTGCQKERVIGMAGVLDSGRFAYFLSKKLGVAQQDIHALVLGGHGDLMVPLLSATSVRGIPLQDLIDLGKVSQEDCAEVVRQTREGGAQIVQLMQQGSAYLAPAESCFQMIKAILHDESRILPCSVSLEGQYGVKNLYAGVPVYLDRGGASAVLEYPLTALEKKAFQKSADAVLSDLQEARLLLPANT